MKRFPAGLLALVLMTLAPTAAIAQSDHGSTGMVVTESDRYLQLGYASWYNKGFHGLRTASGEIYDHGAMTAAHPTLPFNTMVRLTRTDTGHSVVVRINDRMGPQPKHIIDLSGAAAEKMDMLTSGIAHVEVRIVTSGVLDESQFPSQDEVPVRVANAQEMPIFTLQVGAFNSLKGAEEFKNVFPDAWISEERTGTGISYKVFLGRYRVEEAARQVQRKLWEEGQDSFLRKMTP